MFLVTGGAGFIGSHIVHRLVREGRSVRVLDDFSTGRPANLADVHGQIELIRGDIRDHATVRRAVAGVDVVFHQAAQPSTQLSVIEPAAAVDINVSGTLNVLTEARDAGCHKFVFASSAAVYGDTCDLPCVESMVPIPQSPYALSKLAGEQLCSVFSHSSGLETVALRYFTVFGPRQDGKSPYAGSIARFIADLGSGRAPVVFGDGEQSRDYVFVDDVVKANLLAASVPDVAGRVFNVATGQPMSVNRILDAIRRVVGSDRQSSFQQGRRGDIRRSLGDTSLARRDLGFFSRTHLDDALAATVAASSVPAAFAAAFADSETARSMSLDAV